MSLGTIGSGLDIASLVSRLVASERAPRENQINTAGTAATAKVSALGTIKSGMTSLQSALSTLVRNVATPGLKTSTPTESNFSATIDTSATAGKPAAGTHEIEVKSLAQNQKLSTKAYEKDAIVGDGALSIGYGDKTIDVTIPAGSKLTDIAAAINTAAGGKGVTAAVITADDGQHLVLSAVDAGSKGALTISTTGGNGGLADLAHDPAGASKMNLLTFSAFTLAGSAVWNGLLVSLGAALGTQYELIEQYSRYLNYAVYLAIAGVVIWLVVRRIRRSRHSA